MCDIRKDFLGVEHLSYGDQQHYPKKVLGLCKPKGKYFFPSQIKIEEEGHFLLIFRKS